MVDTPKDEIFCMVVTVEEARKLNRLDGEWASLDTVAGLYSYHRILGISRTRLILNALSKKQKVNVRILKVMVCGGCGTAETLAPIEDGEHIAVGKDPHYRCFACKVLEDVSL